MLTDNKQETRTRRNPRASVPLDDSALIHSIDTLRQSNDRISLAFERVERWRTIKTIAFTLFFVGPLLGVFLFSYLKTVTGTAKDASFASVVSITGPILQGHPAGADLIIPKLAKVFDDKKSSAVIVKINSVGGSPVQSDRIRQTIIRLRNKYPDKKVVAVGADMLTSGAYLIAAGAEQIYANKSTVVGSIGAVSQGFDFTEVMQKVGIKERVHSAGDMKSGISPFSPVKEYQTERLNYVLQGVHENFKNIVVESRGEGVVDPAHFNGDFWLGEDALDKGLIDGIATIEEVAEMIGVDGVNYHRSFSDMFPRGIGVMAQSLVSVAIDAIQNQPVIIK